MKLSATDQRNLRTLLLVSAFEPLEIGRRIARARQEAGGMTQDELSDLLGVTARSVQGYEAGDVVPWKYFSRLEGIFQRDLDWFLHGERAEVVADTPSILRRLEALSGEVAQTRRLVAEALGLQERERELEAELQHPPADQPQVEEADGP